MQSSKIDRREFESLEQLRNELSVQAALFKADMKQEWEKLETEWKVLSRQVRPIKAAAKETVLDVEAASSLLFDTLKEGYERMKRTLH